MSFLDAIHRLFGGCHKHEHHATVIVREGDTLSGIAQKITGDADNWHKIAELTPDLDDPNMIHPGDKLNIPLDWVE